MLPPFHMLIDAKLWFSFLITKHNFKKLSHELLEWFVFEPTELWYDVLDSNVSYFCMSGKFFIFYFQVFCKRESLSVVFAIETGVKVYLFLK